MYSINLTKKYKKKLAKIDHKDAKKIAAKIDQLAINPRPRWCEPLENSDAYRIAVGNYRVIYAILDKIYIIEIIDVGHRKDIYENY